MPTDRYTAPGLAYRDLPRGPNGRVLCRYCGTEVRGRRRTFCSEACVREWRIRTSGAYARECVFERDHGICANCHLDVPAFEAEVKTIPDAVGRYKFLKAMGWPAIDLYSRHTYSWMHSGAHMLPSLWEAHHITPVVRGGGQCGLEGYITLCLKCHAAETADLAALRARERPPDKRRRLPWWMLRRGLRGQKRLFGDEHGK